MKTYLLKIVLFLSIIASHTAVADVRGDLDRSGQEMRITIHYAADKTELDKMVKREMSFDLGGQSGIAFYSKEDNICDVFVIRPKRDTMKYMAVVGHEIMHCTDGKFH